MTGAPGEWPPRVNVTRVHELHAAALTHAGGAPGVRELGLLESAVEGALTAALYATDSGEPEPLQIAAHLLCYLARNHPFVDGNKRVAWLACEEQLRLIRLRVAATTDDAELLVLDVVARRLDACDVVEWLAARLTAYEG
jgi:death-on-curing protein